MTEIIRTKLTISYDAEGDLESHQINAKDLGNAIIGMDELIKTTAKIVSIGSSEANLQVIAPAKEGSLEIIFAILADPVTTKAILANVGFATTGLAIGTATAISIIEKIRDRKIDRITVDVKTQIATIEIGEEKIQAPNHVAQLVSNKDIRQALNKVIKAPLQNHERAKVKFISDYSKVELSTEEVKAFEPLKTGSLEEVSISIEQKVIHFTKLNFKGRSGWGIRSTDGLECNVTINDDTFMQRIAANEEAFKKDKLYTVDLEHTQTIAPGISRNSYIIKRVINEFTP